MTTGCGAVLVDTEVALELQRLAMTPRRSMTPEKIARYRELADGPGFHVCKIPGVDRHTDHVAEDGTTWSTADDGDEVEGPTLRQVAPYPYALREIVAGLGPDDYKPGYSIALHDDYPRDKVDGKVVGRGMTLIITASVPDSVGDVYDTYDPETKGWRKIAKGETITVNHLFIVPAATFNRESWLRWLLDRCVDVEVHEVCEALYVDGVRPFAPHHGNGENPYTVWHHGTEEQRQKRSGVQ